MKSLIVIYLMVFSISGMAVKNSDVKKWKAKVNTLAKQTNKSKAMQMRWHLTNEAISMEQNSWALQSLKYMLSSKNSFVSKDRIQLNLARTYYQMGYLTKAIAEYTKISADSPFWFTAMEEKAWAYLRKSKEEDTLSVLKTLHNDIFYKQSSSESFYLSALANYRVCDYKSVFATTKKFQEIFIPKVQSLELISNLKVNSYVNKYLKVFEELNLQRKNLSTDLAFLPSMLLADRSLEREYKHWSAIKSKNIKLPNSMKNRILKRLSLLAKQELKLIERDLNLLQLVEAEVIQRIHFVDKSSDKLKNEFAKVDGKENLAFPVDENEIWLDELDNYKFSLKTCPNVKGGGYVKK